MKYVCIKDYIGYTGDKYEIGDVVEFNFEEDDIPLEFDDVVEFNFEEDDIPLEQMYAKTLITYWITLAEWRDQQIQSIFTE